MTGRQLISWNVNGLRAVHRKGAFDWFLHTQPDILCVQETKAQAAQLDAALTAVDGYHAYFASAERKGYSGVAVYSKEQPLNVSAGLGDARFDQEGRTLVVEYAQFVLCNVYFPNGQASAVRLRYKIEFYAAFLAYLDRLKGAGKPIVLCGDVNTAHQAIDLARPKENEQTSGFLPAERAWLDELIQHGFVDTFRMFNREPGHYTWWSARGGARQRNVGWRIDYFFVNQEFAPQVKAAFILPNVAGSDHCPLGITIEV